jgi:hypothetical protein
MLIWMRPRSAADTASSDATAYDARACVKMPRWQNTEPTPFSIAARRSSSASSIADARARS